MFCTKLEKISIDIISTTASGHARCRYVERRIPLVPVIGLYQSIDESTDTVQVQNSSKGIFGVPVCRPTYQINGDKLIARPPEAHMFFGVIAPPPGTPLGGIRGEWLPPENWMEPPPGGWGPEGSQPDGGSPSR